MPTNKAVLLYNNKASETKDRLVQVAREKFGLTLLTTTDSARAEQLASTNNCKIIRYGEADGFGLNKVAQLELFKDIMPNLLLSASDLGSLDRNELIVVKSPTVLTVRKEYEKLKRLGLTEGAYKYIPTANKREWRVNCSFGKVNNVINKNINSTTIFGKADQSTWGTEQNSEIRAKLIDKARLIMKRVADKGYTKLEHFGLDIIQDTRDGKFYLLELNKAHSLSADNCVFFLKGFLERQGVRSNTTRTQDSGTPFRPMVDAETRQRIARLQRELRELQETLDVPADA